MKKTLLMGVVLLPAIALAIACGNSDSGEGGSSPEDAVRRQLEYLSNGQFGRNWEELHPAHQAIVSKEEYTQCADNIGSFEVVVGDAVEVYDETIQVMGADTESKAVTFEFEVNGSRDTDTFHEVRVDQEWKWILQPAAVEAFQNGECP